MKTPYKNVNYSFFLLLGLLLLGCAESDSHDQETASHSEHSERDHSNADIHQSHDEGEHGDRHEDHEKEEDSAIISAEAIQKYRIETKNVGSQTIATELELLGQVSIDRDRLQYITPRYSGVVQKVLKHVGDSVTAGDTLAILENNDTLSTYPLKAFVHGTVTKENISIGEVLESGHEAFVIADTAKVWVDLQVYPGDLSEIKQGQKASITFGDQNEIASGRIFYVSPVIDKDSQTGLARLVVDNASGVLYPGRLIQARLETSKANSKIAVERSALIRNEGTQVVALKNSEGAFELREVRVGRQGSRFVEIISGLSEGEEVVTKGGFLVKSEISKGAMGGGHSH